jgi:hypothetical protein
MTKQQTSAALADLVCAGLRFLDGGGDGPRRSGGSDTVFLQPVIVDEED